ncbi:MAG: LysR family transcriptional regulator [Oscillospiraceae bacterium]|nr:LysR family transcriptional regulator [Oscillospiraceae bacterium]
MDISDYTFFSVLARELNVSKTAELLYITPQALSKRIINLERYYGVALFERKPKFRLTYAGERLLQYYNDMALMEARAKAEIADIADRKSGRVRIGISPVRSAHRFAPIIIRFNELYPRAEINICNESVTVLLKKLLDGEIDLVLSVSTIQNTNVKSIDIATEGTYFFISDTCLRRFCTDQYESLLEAERESTPVSILEFARCPFVLQTAEMRVRQKMDDVFGQYQLTPQILLSVNSSTLRMDMVQNDLGATVSTLSDKELLRMSRDSSAGKNVHRFAIQELAEKNMVKVSYMTNRYMPQYCLDLIDLIVEEY